MNELRIAVFNVGMGQSILVYPMNQPSHTCLIDCGSDKDFCPADYLFNNSQYLKLPTTNGKPTLGNLLLTNYDQDHFSSIDKLKDKMHIWTTTLSNNIDSQKLKDIKDEVTPQLQHVCELKDNYTSPANDFNPVYTKTKYYLNNDELDSDYNTNHLSQIVFIEYGGSKICIAGDLEKPAWDIMLKKESVQNELRDTNILVAPHHGRENGFNDDVFNYCSPEVVLISDKSIIHETQEGVTQLYGNKVLSDGVVFDGNKRKVLTTRNDGHILISFNETGIRNYQKINLN